MQIVRIYDILKSMSAMAGQKALSAMQVVMYPAQPLFALYRRVKQGLGNRTFLKETSLSPVAKGGMSHESDGAPHASHGHSQLAGADRGRDTLDH